MNDQLKISLSAMVDGEADELEFRRVMKAIEGASEVEASAILEQWQRYQIISAGLRKDLSGSLANDNFASKVARAVRQEGAVVGVPDSAIDSATDEGINKSEISDTGAAAAVSEVLGTTTNADVSSVTATMDSQGGSSSWRRFAVAASVALAVVVGFQEFDANNSESGLSIVQSVLSGERQSDVSTDSAQQLAVAIADTDAEQLASVQIQSASSQINSNLSATGEAGELDPISAAESQKRLNDYLLRHANNAAQQGGQGVIPFTRLANFEDE